MTPTRATKADDIKAILDSRVRQTKLPADDRIKEKLTDLRTFIGHLAQTPIGRAELQQRIQVLGNCVPNVGESDRHFYGRLRHWLDRDMKS